MYSIYILFILSLGKPPPYIEGSMSLSYQFGNINPQLHDKNPTTHRSSRSVSFDDCSRYGVSISEVATSVPSQYVQQLSREVLTNQDLHSPWLRHNK